MRVIALAAAICLFSDPAFEVASVKLSAPMDDVQERMRDRLHDNIPLGLVPGPEQRFEMRHATLAQLIAVAYEIRPRTVVGPSWIYDARFDVFATIPSGHPRQEGPEMLRNLLQERFALRTHRDVRKMSGYVLTVGKGGPKLKEAVPLVPMADTASLLNRPRPRVNGDHLWEFGHVDMARLADVLAQNLEVPVEDQTGLKGFYAMTLRIAGTDSPDAPERAARFQDALSELGLRLASAKVEAPILIVDNASKTPTEN
jgi:uncharacterized protein (TIGR03435 family)